MKIAATVNYVDFRAEVGEHKLKWLELLIKQK